MLAQLQSTSAARMAPPAAAVLPAPSTGRIFAGPATITPEPSSLLPTPGEYQGLAHDAANLLGALRLYSDLLSTPGVLSPEHRHYAAELRLLSNRGSQLIERLLTQPATKLTAPITHQLSRSLLQLAPLLNRIASPKATVHVTVQPSIARIHPSAHFPPIDVIERIVLNLVSNAAEAIKASSRSGLSISHRRRGTIQVSLALDNQCLRLEVADDGPGIPLAVASAFLHPLPTPPATRHGHGHRIVHQLARDSGAGLTIRVRPGHGTTFIFDWPLAAFPAKLSAAQQRSQESTPAC